MKTYNQLIADALPGIIEKFPWDIQALQAEDLLLVDIREPYEFEAMRIEGSINAPRGILEQCCEWDYEETIPELTSARDKKILLVCRSGNRSILAAAVMQLLGFTQVFSLKTGLRGWNDYELPLVNSKAQIIDIETADDYFISRVRDDQKIPV